ncbi:MAG: hypothetical protein ACJASU_001368 [Cognaticolwellia sp.]|jgi:hypothetical protein
MSRALKKFKAVSFVLRITVLGFGSGLQVKNLEVG